MRSRIALTMLAAVLAAGCAPTSTDVASDDVAPDAADAGPTASDTADPEPTPGDAANAVTVSIGDYFFEPDEVSLAVGDTVTWSHDGDLTHNVTATDGSFASDNLATGQTFTHTFAEAGSFEYRCTLHGQMIATLDVS